MRGNDQSQLSTHPLSSGLMQNEKLYKQGEFSCLTRSNYEGNPESSRTVHVFIEDEVEKLNESVLVFIQKDVGDARVHFSDQPWFQPFWVVLRLGTQIDQSVNRLHWQSLGELEEQKVKKWENTMRLPKMGSFVKL